MSEELPFGDSDRARALVRLLGDRLAAVVIEPVVEREPPADWLTTLREETRRIGALLVLDEIKTGFRLAVGGATERYGIKPDLVVLGKALANGFPLAAVGGRREVMEEARRTWISSTLATEMVALAAAEATLDVVVRDRVPEGLGAKGARLLDGLRGLANRHPAVVKEVAGLPEMCHVRFVSESVGALVARFAASRGLLWKRTAYNFVSLAHDDTAIGLAIEVLDASCKEVTRSTTV